MSMNPSEMTTEQIPSTDEGHVMQMKAPKKKLASCQTTSKIKNELLSELY